MTYLFLLLGFFSLIKGADMLVEGATALAKQYGVSDLVIGLTIVSMGTSMPEMIVSIIASLEGRPEMATGNVLGSNIANILLILGATALVRDLPVKRNTILSEIPFSMAAALLVGFLANSTLWYEHSDHLAISRGDGIVILFFFFLFMSYVFVTAKEDQAEAMLEGNARPNSKPWKSAAFVFSGILGLFLGGKWVVEGATVIAQQFGMSESLIGLTVVALGTSLPELVTSISAARKGNTDIAMGNAIGSNIFNLLWILGVSALIKPLPFNVLSNADIMVVIGASCLILLSLIFYRRMVIKRMEGLLFLLAYFAYLIYVIQRG